MVFLLRATLLAPEADQSLDITIELKPKRPRAEMLLEVTTDTEKKEYKIRRSKEETIRGVPNEKMCVLTFFPL